MATIRALFLTMVVLTSMLAYPAPGSAGEIADYPEFPYQPTDYTENYRGQFHFSPRGGWMNDINAPLYYRGTYHLFFQHNPHSLAWETMHWGHATSPDLVHWTQKPIALEPGVHPGDLWSGSGVVDVDDTAGLRTGAEDPIVVFTGTNGVRIAYSNDAGRTFQSYGGGAPVVVPAGTSRDAKVFRHNSTWVMVVWSDAGGNGVDILTSPNLLDWTFRSRYSASWLYETPDLFALPVDGDTADVRWVLTDAEGEYVVGQFTGTTFSSDWTAPQRMDRGRTTFDDGTFYAGLTVNNMPDGRVVQLAWQPSNRGATWTGNATFPAELGLRTFADGVRVTRNPIAELASLRTSTQTWADRTITTDPAADPLAGVTADTYEIEAEFDLTGATATQFGFALHTRADGTADRTVTYDLAARTLYGAPLPPVDDRVRVRLLVDRGQLEVSGNDGQLSYSDNVNFDRASQGVRLFAVGGAVRLVSLRLSRLGSAWGTGESTLESTLAGPWHPVGGAWTDVAFGKRGSATGDAFSLSEQTGTDFTYSGDVRVMSGAAAALTFRSSVDGATHYTANVDTAGLVKLWRPGRDIATYPTTIVAGRTYHLKVVASGASITVYLDGAMVIAATDTAYTSGRFGANVFAGTAEFQNLDVDTGGLCTNLAAPWRPVGGTWTEPAGRRRGVAAGDAFLLSAQSGSDLTYEGDLMVRNGTAAGLTFRATADGTGHYTANVDTSGLVKLWRPGTVIATGSATIIPGRTYHLKVTATGPNITVYLNGTQVITATDTTYTSGLFGLNTFAGTGEFRDVFVNGASCTTKGVPS